MVKILTDSSALFTPTEGEKIGIKVVPLVVQIAGKTYRDLEISSEDFMKLIDEGHIPTSSQPPIGEVMEAYEQANGEEILNICMADGLSGTFQSATAAKMGMVSHEHINVLNSHTLCGPQRYLVQQAVELAKHGYSAFDIEEKLQDSILHNVSFLIPYDFAFLKRGGRLKGAAATIGGLLKLKPVMITVDEGTRIDKFTISRTLNGAIDEIVKYAKAHGYDHDTMLYISDADNQKAIDTAVSKFEKELPNVTIETLKLGAAFITQGGPHAISIQFIKKVKGS